MRGLIHFAVGATGGILLAAAFRLPPRRAFLAVFLSGAWAMVPDAQLAAKMFGLTPLTRVLHPLHDSILANIFWFHHFLDAHEPSSVQRLRYYLFTAMGVLLVSVFGYYKFREWPRPQE